MRKCSVKSCKNSTYRVSKKDGISYFRFPQDQTRCAEWISIVAEERGDKHFKPSTSSVVCSEHFHENDIYITEKGVKRLKSSAVPQLYIQRTDEIGGCSSVPIKTEKNILLESPTTSLSFGSISYTSHSGLERGDEHFKPNNSNVVCSEHFCENDAKRPNERIIPLYTQISDEIGNYSSVLIKTEKNILSESPTTLSFESVSYTPHSGLERGNEHFKPNNSNVVCSEHFCENDANRPNERAIPLLSTKLPDEIESYSSVPIKTEKNILLESPTTSLSFGSVSYTPHSEAERSNEHLKPNSNIVCSDHFCENNVYITENGFNRSNERAISLLSSQIPEEIGSRSSAPIKTVKNILLESPITLSTESVLDSPHTAVIKKQARDCHERLIKRERVLDNLRKKNKRLIKKNISLKSALDILKRKYKSDKVLYKDLSRHINSTDLLTHLYLKRASQKRYSKYPSSVKKFALTLHSYSPAAYEFIRKTFNTCLPHLNTLYEWHKSVDAEPGSTQETFDILAEESTDSEKETILSSTTTLTS